MARILLVDIETSPTLAAVWSRYDANTVWVVEDWHILCFAYHWYDDPGPVKSVALTDFDYYAVAPEDDIRVCGALHKLLDEADIVVAHNLEKFDEPKINARLIMQGFDPPRPYRTVDTLKVARKHFAFGSNRLADLAVSLGIEHKADAGGYDTWRRCMSGDPEAWEQMTSYCRQDVVVLEQLYTKLRPWMPNHPSLAVIDGRPDACPKCGAAGIDSLQRRGYHTTKLSRRRRYQCTNCGGWSMGRKLENTAVQYLN